MRKLFYLSLVLFSSSLIFAQEPSAFNAGGSEPRKTETQILNEKFFNLSTQVKHLEESQEGLKSIFEGQTQRVQDVFSKIELLKGENNATLSQMKSQVDSNFALQNENIEKIKHSISALGALIKKTNAQMQEEINGLKTQIAALEMAQKTNAKVEKTKDSKEVAKTDIKKDTNINAESQIAIVEVDSLMQELASPSQGLINAKENNETSETTLNKTTDKAAQTTQTQEAKQESKQETKANSKQEVTQENKEVKEAKAESEQKEQEAKAELKPQEVAQKPKVDLKNKPLSDVFKDGEAFFSNKKYEEADEYLQFAVKNNYKPARGNYLLGEISFAQKKYEDAIYYYKTSATRYDKADYMPRLMLNSAKSFNAINEKENAKRFLETLISLYPKSNEAKEAKKLLK